MKKLLCSLLIFLSVISVAAFASPGGKCGHGDRMVKQLDLTEEQAVKFREVMQAKREKMHSFHAEQHQETMNQLGSVLSAEQMDEFQQMRESHRQHRKEKCKNKE